MYTPPFNSVRDEPTIRELVAAFRSAWLVTVRGDGLPAATLLPVIWRDGVVVAHMAKANPHWRAIADGAAALLIAGGPQAYISPSWYAANAEHGKVVPTWNYTAIQLTGTVRTNQDPQWLRRAVTDLTDVHEADREDRWQVSDAPEAYIEGQLRGIVGVEFTVTGATGKAKLSQNRSDADQDGVIAGLHHDNLTPPDLAAARAVADTMDARRVTHDAGSQP